MATHIVTVKYIPDPITGQLVLVVSPDLVRVSPGDILRFVRQGTSVGKMRLTFTDKQFFDTCNPLFAETGEFHEGDGDVQVKLVPDLTGRTSYDCDLLDPDNPDNVLARNKGGGAVEPVRR